MQKNVLWKALVSLLSSCAMIFLCFNAETQETTKPRNIEEQEKLAILNLTIPAGTAIEGVTNSDLDYLTGVIRDVAARICGKKYLIMDADNMEAILKQYGKSLECVEDTACAVDIGQTLESEYVVVSSLIPVGEELKVTVRIYNTINMQPLAPIRVGAAKSEGWQKKIENELVKELPGVFMVLPGAEKVTAVGTLKVRVLDEKGDLIPARVIVDGSGLGPSTKDFVLSVGEHAIKIKTEDGRLAGPRVVKVAENETQTAEFKLDVAGQLVGPEKEGISTRTIIVGGLAVISVGAVVFGALKVVDAKSEKDKTDTLAQESREQEPIQLSDALSAEDKIEQNNRLALASFIVAGAAATAAVIIALLPKNDEQESIYDDANPTPTSAQKSPFSFAVVPINGGCALSLSFNR